MKITVKTLSGETFPIEVEVESTVLQIKEKINGVKGFAIDAQKILRKGKVLNDEETVGSIGMQEGDFVVVMVNIKKPAPKPQQQQPPQQSSLQPTGEQAQTQPRQEQTTSNNQQSQQSASQITSSSFQTGASALLTGQEYENFLNEVVSMGFTKEQGQAAMKASYNNPERALEFILNA